MTDDEITDLCEDCNERPITGLDARCDACRENANMTDDTLAQRLLANWMAWGSPVDREVCVNETCMALDCKEAADEIERLERSLFEARQAVLREGLRRDELKAENELLRRALVDLRRICWASPWEAAQHAHKIADEALMGRFE